MSWVGGLAEWEDGDTTYLSVAFTWKLDEARTRAMFARALGRRVVAGGPALFHVRMRPWLADVAEIAENGMGAWPDVVTRHNPRATIASRGCPGRGTPESPSPCHHCIVPKMWGTSFTLLPEFVVRPILCDDNLSALPVDYQAHIIRRYRESGVQLEDANSGFEPVTFTDEVYHRWAPLINGGGGVWRFGYDQMEERDDALRVMRMLTNEPQRRKRVYVLIGNEPFADCMQRIEETIAYGCEPHVQPFIKLTEPERRPAVRYDWTEQRLKDVARWANGWVWRGPAGTLRPFKDYDRHRGTAPRERYDEQQGLFV
jgi:hypothetical protein